MNPKLRAKALTERELARFLRRGWFISALREDLTVQRLAYGSSGYHVSQGVLTGKWYAYRVVRGRFVSSGPALASHRPDGARVFCEEALRESDPKLYRKICAEGRESAGGRS